MSLGIMLKGLPRTFNYRRFEYLLQETELLHYVESYHIPKAVFDRRDDSNAPYAIAFVNFYDRDMTDYARKRLHHHSIHEKEENKWYVIHTTYAHDSGWQEDSPSQLRKSNVKKQWTVKRQSDEQDAEHTQRSEFENEDDPSQLTLALEDRKPEESPMWTPPIQWGWETNSGTWDEGPAYPAGGSWEARHDEFGITSSGNYNSHKFKKPPTGHVSTKAPPKKTFKEQVDEMDEQDLRRFVKGVAHSIRSW